MILRVTLLMLLALLAACAPATAPQPTQRLANAELRLPPMRQFGPVRVMLPTRSNADIARDFLDLSFQLESGRVLPVFTRFEGAITLRVTGDPPASLTRDLDRLLQRLSAEAGVNVTQVDAGRPASINIETISRSQLQRTVPQAACFVVPRVASWEDFRATRRRDVTDWATLTTRETLSIFIPRDVSPQEIRDCLHEEIAQALGPLNDLYRLDDSVFNDDNFHTILTGFDILMLRITYAPELRSGMSRAEVARQLPGILNRLNPGGAGRASSARPVTSRDWIAEIETALGPRTAQARRQRAAKRAVSIAATEGWNDNRLAFSLFALGRLSLGREPELALNSFLQAAALYGTSPATDVHEAHIAMQLSAFALSSGQATSAIAIVDANTDAVMRAENAALLATLLTIKAEALSVLGREAEAETVRQEGLGWARYGFGSDDEVRRRVSEIEAISPANRPGTDVSRRAILWNRVQ